MMLRNAFVYALVRVMCTFADRHNCEDSTGHRKHRNSAALKLTQAFVMSLSTNVSVVIPVRNDEAGIERRIERVLEALDRMTRESSEVIVVDDASRDGTPDVLNQIGIKHPQVRVVRHSRPRGLEAAGQSGLEAADGELIFIQESNNDVRIKDLFRLHRMSLDKSVVAARAESRPRPIAPSLIRRLRSLATSEKRIDSESDDVPQSSIQMIRRQHLNELSGPKAKDYRLQGETMVSSSVETVS